MPVAQACRSRTKNGTSAPKLPPQPHQSLAGQPQFEHPVETARTVAASEEPPPSPAATGMRLSMVIATRRVTPARSSSRRAARAAIFSSPGANSTPRHSTATAAACPTCDLDPIEKGDPLHQHEQFMITVCAPAQNMQAEVDLGRGQEGFPHQILSVNAVARRRSGGRTEAHHQKPGGDCQAPRTTRQPSKSTPRPPPASRTEPHWPFFATIGLRTFTCPRDFQNLHRATATYEDHTHSPRPSGNENDVFLRHGILLA